MVNLVFKVVDGVEMVETPHSHQLIESNGRWKNKLFVTEYHRIIQREKNNTTKPYLNEDYKFKYQTYRYVPKEKNTRHCQLCNSDIQEGRWSKHIESKIHKNIDQYLQQIRSQ